MTSPSQPATSEALAQNLEGYARDCIHIGSVESVNDLINAAAIIRDAIAAQPTSPSVDDAERIMGALLDYRDMKPEDGETWESWYFAAFDLASAKIRKLLPALSAPRVEPVSDNEMIERVENILRSKKTVSYPSYAAAEYVREQLQELLSAYLRLRKQIGGEK